MSKNLYTIGELKNLKLGDKVLISFTDFEYNEGFNLEESELVIIDPDTIYFNNDFGSWDFSLDGNDNYIASQHCSEYELKIYHI